MPLSQPRSSRQVCSCKCVYDPHLLVWWYCAECVITIEVVSVRYVSAMQQYGLDLVLLYTMPALFDVLPLDELSTTLHKSPDVLLDLICVHRITLSTLCSHCLKYLGYFLLVVSVYPQSAQEPRRGLKTISKLLHPPRTAFAAAAQIADRGDKSLDLQTVPPGTMATRQPLRCKRINITAA